MNRDERDEQVFRRLFPQALAALEKIDELPERINRAIGLIFPLSVFEWAPNVFGDKISPRRFCEAIFEQLAPIEAGGERDYLTRLLATEAFRYALWSEEELETRIGQIGDEEEKQAAYYAWGKFAAASNQRQIAERCAERLDDLACYEKIVRRILTAENDTASDSPLAVTIESAEGRFRLVIDRAERVTRVNGVENNGVFDTLITKAGEILSEIDESRHRDELLVAAWEQLAGATFERLEPLAGRFHSAAWALDGFQRYDLARFGAEIPSSVPAEISAERLNVSRRIEQALKSLCTESLLPSDRIAALASAARFFYRIGEKNRSRDAVREILELVKRISNRVERANVYQTLWPILADAGEKSAWGRILGALENATDEIEPDDLRALLWRENLLLALNRGEKETFERFLPKLPPSERAVFAASALLRWDDTQTESILTVLEPLETVEPLVQAVGLIKVARYNALRALEKRAK